MIDTTQTTHASQPLTANCNLFSRTAVLHLQYDTTKTFDTMELFMSATANKHNDILYCDTVLVPSGLRRQWDIVI